MKIIDELVRLFNESWMKSSKQVQNHLKFVTSHQNVALVSLKYKVILYTWMCNFEENEARFHL